MAMSRIRHLVWETQSDARNSSGDENARAAKPSSISKSGSDSRTDSSSSTTDTIERMTVIDFSCAPRPQPQASSTLKLVYSHWRSLGKSMCPPGSAAHTNPGSVLTTRLNSFSKGALPGGTPQHEDAPRQWALSIAPWYWVAA